MFEFHWPWAALLLPLPLLLLLIRFGVRRSASDTPPAAGQEETLLHPHPEALRLAFGIRSGPAAPRNWRYPALLALLWLALVLALMRPQWLVPQTEISSPGYDLMIAVDASHSMEALDFTVAGQQVNRMAVVKGVMGRFIEGRANDRAGLIVFGSQAFVLAPLSLDRRAVRQVLDGLEPGIAGPATALGDAMALGIKRLRERPAGSRVMIVIADGDNNAGNFGPDEAARLAHQSGIRVHVIGVGSTQTRIPIREEGRIRYREDLTMDENQLRAIARTTGGDYFRATDTGALETISARIDALEKTESETRTAWLPHPLYRWPLSLALLTWLALGLFPEGRRLIPRERP